VATSTTMTERLSMENETLEVSIEAWPGHQPVGDAQLFDLTHAIEAFEGRGASTSIGGITGGIGATFAVTKTHAGDDPANLMIDVCRAGIEIFLGACEKAGIIPGQIAKIEVFTGSYLDAELEQEPEGFVGVTEVARELGVSRQRVSELRARPDFPAPVAELAAGPVWKVSNLRRFVREWPRKSGRPRRQTA
jgi:hypothetical protein